MTTNLKRVFGDKLLHQMLTLLTGSAIGTIIYFLFQPLIARLYSPTDIGIFAFIFSIVTMFSTVINGHYDLAIVSAKDEEEANKLVSVGFLFSTMFITIIGITILLLAYFYPNALNQAGKWSLSACLFLLIFSVNNLLTSYNNRLSQYKIISKVSIYKNIGRSLLPVALYFTKIGFVGLVLGNIFGYLMGMGSQLKGIKKSKIKIKMYPLLTLKETAIKYSRQPLFSAPGLFFVAASNSLISFYIGHQYGLSNLGYFFMASSILGIPISIISSNMGRVFFKSASDEIKKEHVFNKSFTKTSKILAVLTIPIFLTIFIFIEPIFLLVFGSEWTTSALFIKLQIPMFLIRFIVTALMYGYILSGSQLKKLINQSFFIVITFVSIIVSKLMNLNVENFISLSNALIALVYLYMYFDIYKISKNCSVESR